ncbi:MAG: chemotaxis protein CheA [Allosphingosinicella sp.]
MDDLINEFLAETREMLQALSDAIVAWETEPADRTRLDEIFRFVHTVKGNCGFFDLPRLQGLSHAAEDALADVRAGRRAADPRLVSAVLAVIDRIGELALALETGEALASDDDEQIIAALSATPVQAAPEGEASAPVAETKKGLRSIRLSVDLLDRMMNGVSDAVLARNELARRLRDTERDVAVEAAFERVSACIAEIRDAVTRTRMQRIDNLFTALPRMVRDLSAELGKQVQLDIDGGDVELDREMIEMIRDPLSHIVRNAIDHGLEPAAERTAAGKNAIGALRICARQAGNQILIEVSDDGRGIDTDALVRKAIAAGILSAERAEGLSVAQKNALMFAPGVSTAGAVTAISGRGVGMDVVRANIERVGGVTDVESRPGQGVRLSIRVPLTLTIIPALTVSAGGQIFAIPRSGIEEILRAAGGAVKVDSVGESLVATIRGRRVPLVSLSQLLAVEPRTAEVDRKVILLKPAGGDVYALTVDAVHDHEELVVKPAAPAIMSAGLYAGTTLADDGRPILLLDPSGMAKQAGIRLEDQEIQRHLVERRPPVEPVREETLLLFRGLDGRCRALPVAVIERIEDVPASAIAFSAGRHRVAVNGRILPLAGGIPPGSEAPLRILRLSDGACEIAYGFAEVVDIRSLVLDLQPSTAPGEVAGVALVDGAQVEFIDPYWLFSQNGDGLPDVANRPVCALPESDPWIQNMLRPLIESLGYHVVAAREGVEADVLIASADMPQPRGVAATEIVRIRSAPDQGSDADDSIYRYDRAALLSALSRGARHGGCVDG